MRFVISGEWTKNSLLRLIMFFFLFYIAAFWITNGLLYFHKMSLNPQMVIEYYRGSELHYTQPRSYQGLLEVSHFHLFAMGILILTLTHLLLFAELSQNTKAYLIISSFSAAFLDELSSWLIRFVHPLFAYLKIFSFLALEISLLVIMVLVLRSLIIQQPSAYHKHNRS